MHEIGLCEALLETVERRAAGRRVARVTVRVGVLHRVVEPSLAQAFELVAGGTVADGAEVELVTVPVTAKCERCGTVTTAGDAVPACPACGATGLTITGGDELILE